MTKFFRCQLIAGVLGLGVFATALSAAAADSRTGAADEWRFGIEPYLWAPWIDVTTETGGDVEISLDDILKNLDMLFMADLSVGKGRWSFVTDFIYFKLESNQNENLPLSLKLDEADLEAWVVTPQVRYSAVETDKYQLGLVGGARYLWIEAQLQLDTRPPLPPARRNAKDSGSVWDGIVGVTGQVDLSEKWYLQGYADVGTGESDLTWQALAMFGYRFRHFDAAAGYRYLDYNFSSDDAISDLTVNGPFAGVKFAF